MVEVVVDYVEVWYECGEWVVGDFWLCVRDLGDEGVFVYVGEVE